MDHRRSVVLIATTAAMAAGVIAAKITWRDLAPMPVGVAGGASAVLRGKVVYAGGTRWVSGVKQWLRDVRLYELDGNSWRVGPELPEPLAYGGKLLTDSGLEVLGGLTQRGPSRNSWRLDSNLARWSKSGLLPQDSVLSRVERVGNTDYLFGGCSDVAIPMRCSNSVWKRDSYGVWTRAGEMPDGAVALRTSTVLDDYVFLFGGCSEVAGGVVNRDSAFRYDPARGEWRELRPLPVPVRGLAAARLGASRILLAGGYTAPMEKAASSGLEDGFTNEVWIYDTGQDRYERATPLPFAVSGIDVIVHDRLILALGGEDRMRSRSRRFIQGKVE